MCSRFLWPSCHRQRFRRAECLEPRHHLLHRTRVGSTPCYAKHRDSVFNPCQVRINVFSASSMVICGCLCDRLAITRSDARTTDRSCDYPARVDAWKLRPGCGFSNCFTISFLWPVFLRWLDAGTEAPSPCGMTLRRCRTINRLFA